MTHNPPKLGYTVKTQVCLTPDTPDYHTHVTILIEGAAPSSNEHDVLQKVHEDLIALMSHMVNDDGVLTFDTFRKSLVNLELFQVFEGEKHDDLDESPLTHKNPGGIQ